MARKKRIRTKGKIKLSEYFKSPSEGERVCIVVEKGVRASFPKKLQGLTGEVVGTRGRFRLVKIKDKDRMKKFIIHPVHLRRV